MHNDENNNSCYLSQIEHFRLPAVKVYVTPEKVDVANMPLRVHRRIITHDFFIAEFLNFKDWRASAAVAEMCSLITVCEIIFLYPMHRLQSKMSDSKRRLKRKVALRPPTADEYWQNFSVYSDSVKCICFAKLFNEVVLRFTSTLLICEHTTDNL